VPEAKEGGAEAELQYVEVLEDTEGTQANPTDEGKLRCNKPSISKFLCNHLWMIVHLRSGVDMEP
jgi:hypothetical protein